MNSKISTTALAPTPRLRLALVAASLALVAFSPAQAVAVADSEDPKVQLTDGWHARVAYVAAIDQAGQYRSQPFYFDLFLFRASEYRSLMAFAKRRHAGSVNTTHLANRQETELAERQVGGRKIVEFEITGEHDAMSLHYRYIELKVGDHYCNLICWTTAKHWAEAQPLFDGLVKNLK